MLLRALLQEKGYASFTIEEVARRSGASKSTIYRWWSSKMHLLLDIYGDEVEKMIGFLILAILKLKLFFSPAPSGNSGARPPAGRHINQ